MPSESPRWPSEPEHPSAAELAALFDGRLRGERARRVGLHLEGCPSCEETLEEIRGFSRSDREAGRTLPGEAGVAAAWQDLRPRLRPRPTGPPRPGSRPVLARLAAALLLAALAGSLLWNLSLRRRLGALRDGRPAAASAWSNVQIIDLDPEAGTVRAAGEGPSLGTVSAAAGVTLLLHGASAKDAPGGFALAIRDAEGTPVLRLEGLVPTPSEYVTLSLPAGLLRPGEYRLTLTPAGAEGGSPGTTYALSVVP